MTLVRSLLYVGLYYLWSGTMAITMLPLLLGPRRWVMAVTAFWARGTVALLKPLCGVRVEFRGIEHLPAGAALVAAKHQCMFDTQAPFTIFADPCYVMRQELLKIPVYGLYCRKTQMVVIDREGRSAALRKLVADSRVALQRGRQLVIFPEGHRQPPGQTGDYKPGIAALYRDLGLPVTPMATNSGVHWPAHGFTRTPGTVVYEFLPAIPPGLRRAEFMRVLEERLESASRALLTE